MRTEELNKVYNDVTSTPIRSLDYSYFDFINYNSSMESTGTGNLSDTIKPSLNFNDSIFSELPSDVVNDNRVQPFLIALYDAYIKQRLSDYTYLPLIVGEHDEESVILDWIYETVRISFYFMKEKNVYSVTRYDVKKNSYSQKIEDMPKGRYQEIATQIIQEIA